jgi:hypothetical protein
MSDPENFLSRWSRRKRRAAEEPAADAQTAPEVANVPPAEAKKDETFDPASLPPIESLEAGSDIRAFLQKNVPPDLTRAALRRAWSADPAIRDFVGLSENAWDFNAPDSIRGFGPLEMSDEMRRTLADIMGEQTEASPDTPSASAESVQPAMPDKIAEETTAKAPQDDVSASGEPSQDAADEHATDTARQHEDAALQQNGPRQSDDHPTPRGHGRALPR